MIAYILVIKFLVRKNPNYKSHSAFYKTVDSDIITTHCRYAHMDINKWFKSVSICVDFKSGAILRAKIGTNEWLFKNKTLPQTMVTQ